MDNINSSAFEIIISPANKIDYMNVVKLLLDSDVPFDTCFSNIDTVSNKSISIKFNNTFYIVPLLDGICLSNNINNYIRIIGDDAWTYNIEHKSSKYLGYYVLDAQYYGQNFIKYNQYNNKKAKVFK